MNGLKPEHRGILVECLRRMREHAATPRPPDWQIWCVGDYDEITEFGPRYSGPEWFGDENGLPDALRVRYGRAIRDLESGGLVETYARWGRKLTAIKLTPLGESVAEQLAASAASDVELPLLATPP